jgi:hypothetical protein
VIRALWLGAALGCILVPISEMMFWPVHLGHVPGLIGFYGAAALLAAGMLERTGCRGAPGAVLAAGVLGWLIEGVIVSQTYEAIPFSLSWTPLAWHGLIGVGLALVALRLALLARSIWPGVGVTLLLGGFAGLWNAYGWERFAGDIVGGPVPHGFAVQIVVATAVLGLGHLLLDHLPRGVVPGWVVSALGGLALLVWGAVWALPLFPASLAVPLLIGLTVLLFRRAGRAPEALAFGCIPWPRYALFVVVPAVAIPLEATARAWAPVQELNTWIAAPLALIGAVTWLWAVVRIARRRP